MTITWTDAYQIYARSDAYQEGSKFYFVIILAYWWSTYASAVLVTGGSDPKVIPLGHSYVMKSWDDPPKVINDPAAPANGFCLKNGMECSAVVSTQDPHTKKFVPSQYHFMYFISPLNWMLVYM